MSESIRSRHLASPRFPRAHAAVPGASRVATRPIGRSPAAPDAWPVRDEAITFRDFALDGGDRLESLDVRYRLEGALVAGPRQRGARRARAHRHGARERLVARCRRGRRRHRSHAPCGADRQPAGWLRWHHGPDATTRPTRSRRSRRAIRPACWRALLDALGVERAAARLRRLAGRPGDAGVRRELPRARARRRGAGRTGGADRAGSRVEHHHAPSHRAGRRDRRPRARADGRHAELSHAGRTGATLRSRPRRRRGVSGERRGWTRTARSSSRASMPRATARSSTRWTRTMSAVIAAALRRHSRRLPIGSTGVGIPGDLLYPADSVREWTQASNAALSRVALRSRTRRVPARGGAGEHDPARRDRARDGNRVRRRRVRRSQRRRREWPARQPSGRRRRPAREWLCVRSASRWPDAVMWAAACSTCWRRAARRRLPSRSRACSCVTRTGHVPRWPRPSPAGSRRRRRASPIPPRCSMTTWTCWSR